jgi:hypothetical protein
MTNATTCLKNHENLINNQHNLLSRQMDVMSNHPLSPQIQVLSAPRGFRKPWHCDATCLLQAYSRG